MDKGVWIENWGNFILKNIGVLYNWLNEINIFGYVV
jgi:hypothetical protein